MGVYIDHHVVMTGDVEIIEAIVDNHLTPVPEACEPGSNLPRIDFNTIGVHGFCLHPEWLSGTEIRSPFKVGLEQKFHSQMGNMKEFIDALRARYPTVQIDTIVTCGCEYSEECECGRWTLVPGPWEQIDDELVQLDPDWVCDETRSGGSAF